MSCWPCSISVYLS